MKAAAIEREALA